MALLISGCVPLLLLLLSANFGSAKAYSSEELLIWLQHSNLGYQVLQQAFNGSQVKTDLATSCVSEVHKLLEEANSKSLSALKVLDAWGKYPQGLLYGHFTDMGNYESCLSFDDNSSKYCLANIKFENLIPDSTDSLALNIGTCIPSACSAKQLNYWLTNYLRDIFNESSATNGTLVEEYNCATSDRQPLSGLDWFAICVFVLLALLVLLATILDYREVSSKLLLSFSLRQNVPQLVKTTSTAAAHVIPCLHGIRCLTIIWIIYGHGYMFLLLAPNVNAFDIVAWAQTPYSMILQSGSISVDTFFLLSGLLLVMSTLRELERNSGRLNVPVMYLHRFVRLTPVLALAVLFFMTLFPRLDDGPFWKMFTGSSQLCRETWWATLLYVQNYAAAGKMCLGHSWYLAVDMQLYILSPILLIALYKWGRKAAAVIVAIILLLFGCVFSIVMLNNLQVFQRNGNLGADSAEMRLIYYTTHARANPWLIGLLFGYFLHCNSYRKQFPKWLSLSAWLIALSLIVTVLFAVFPYTQTGSGEISPLSGAFYICCSHIAWPLALCWLIWACQTGQAGLINSFLSWSFWQPLSRLSYCLYIWHLLVETAHMARIKTSLHFSNYDTVLQFWSHFGITLMVSTVMYLCIEAPLVKLEMQLLAPRRTADNKPNPPPETYTISVVGVSQQNLVNA
ncbi:nose resistant to fluoxetine protein 6-like [Drosophila tropicalis]|uniref:nose resistant to fluoxetine protein 6-like n=1 Tax=Drosophila tropicalis TaxID=46794 RepID=UPI0035ABBFBC